MREGNPKAYRRLVEAVRSLANEPRPPGAEKLANFDPPAWRVRVGEYRVVYEIYDSDLLIVVVNLAPRGAVYR
ncbi:MAG: type II toxin-antitoxin system RelE family toxin [Actinomycetota bacterium]